MVTDWGGRWEHNQTGISSNGHRLGRRMGTQPNMYLFKWSQTGEADGNTTKQASFWVWGRASVCVPAGFTATKPRRYHSHVHCDTRFEGDGRTFWLATYPGTWVHGHVSTTKQKLWWSHVLIANVLTHKKVQWGWSRVLPCLALVW